MAATRKWDDLYRNLDALSDEDRDEIALKVAIVGEVLTVVPLADHPGGQGIAP